MARRRPCVGIACLVALLGLFAGGCESKTSTVAGKVTYQGKPVAGGSVIVYCADKQIARGSIGADGTYTIPNVPFGSGTVTVQAPARVPDGLRIQQNTPPQSPGGPIPPTVEADDKRRVSIPQRYALPEESGLSVVVDRGQVTYDIDLKP